ncbi:hypothetical protein KR074_008885 [Drosophila pseudoananassae]|nr:hypothetical protein KR074_008885 [Drosophila pseudoananassae]
MHDNKILELEGPMWNKDSVNRQDDLNELLEVEEFEDEEDASETDAEYTDSDGYSLDGNLASIPEELDVELELQRDDGAEVDYIDKSQQTLPEELDLETYKNMKDSFKHLKKGIRAEKRKFMVNIRFQKKVISLEKRILTAMEQKEESVEGSIPTLADLARDQIIRNVSMRLIESLKMQIEEFKDRLIELKDLQLEYHSKKPIPPTHGVIEYPPNGEHEASKNLVFEKEVNFIKKFIRYRKEYLDFQHIFLSKIVESSSRYRHKVGESYNVCPLVSEEVSSADDGNISSDSKTLETPPSSDSSKSSMQADCIINMSDCNQIDERNIRNKYSEVE